ncbi:MAG: hypothetical protein IPP00_12240 [Actinomycetales bacterium]|uniref:Uncharacterized protein n=1 Tax=Candidatus Phosphoribacter hodrii TaxID=2953743 RepID=A0A9D7TAG3_9MICO|nr:hypothetical protein [Candidatus Phosphoribacter hodrii]
MSQRRSLPVLRGPSAPGPLAGIRRRASAWAARSTAPGGSHWATSTVRPSSSTATNTIRHSNACSTCPPRGFPDDTSTTIVMLERPVRTSCADTSTQVSTCTGR